MVFLRGQESARGLWSRGAQTAGHPHIADETPGFIRSAVLTLSQLLSGDFRFKLTCFQRAYSWQSGHASRLLLDLRQAMQFADERKRWYALGRLMLAQKHGKLDAELVDGHQRLMTLTILFAVLRDLEPDPEIKQWLHGFIAGGSHHPQGRPVWRLSAQATPALAFEGLVQEMSATLTEPDLDPFDMSDAERNIFNNRECIKAELTAPGVTTEFRRDLAEFLAGRCFVTAMIVDDQDDAWTLLRKEQETRLDFSDADQAKAILLTAMPAADRVTCSRLWEGCEAVLTAADMHNLLMHLRAIAWRGRSQSAAPVESEIVKHFNLEAGGYAFMDEVFIPYAERLASVRRGSVAEDAERVRIAAAVQHLSLLDLNTWMPPVLQWLAVRGEEDAETATFFERLERLMWIMKLSGTDPGVQETRLLALLGEIEKEATLERMARLSIEPGMLQDALTSLRSANFAAKHHAGVVLRRLSIAIGRDSGPAVRERVTIEHILPRNPPHNSRWREHFRSKEQIQANFQRFGNVTLLTGEDNQKAGTHDWDKKRPILAASAFVLSHGAAKEHTWTAQTINVRTERLIAQLLGAWGLSA